MRAVLDLVDQGGPAMLAIVALSVVLYSRCFKLLLGLRRMRPRLERVRRDCAHRPEMLARVQEELRADFRQQRIALGSMIAAAPLLGLLGTVSGMVTTFESLSSRSGEQSMEGLAHGISEVLVATQSGLAVALPALLLVTLAHRRVLGHIALLNDGGRIRAEGTR